MVRKHHMASKKGEVCWCYGSIVCYLVSVSRMRPGAAYFAFVLAPGRDGWRRRRVDDALHLLGHFARPQGKVRDMDPAGSAVILADEAQVYQCCKLLKTAGEMF